MLAALLSILLGASAITVAAFCAPHEQMLKLLETRHNERVTQIGVVHGGTLLELLESVDGNTWTLLTVRPTGLSCVVATGVHWEQVDVVGDKKPGA